MLEEEIYGENSPIWEADFTMPASDGTQLGHQTGEGARPYRHLAFRSIHVYLHFIYNVK